MEGNERASTTVEIDKELLLIFKSICVLKELTMSEVIEEMIRDWVVKNKDAGESGQQAEGSAEQQASPEAPETEENAPGNPEEPEEGLNDDVEKQTEGG